MTDLPEDDVVKPHEVDGVAIDAGLLQRLRLAQDAILTRQRVLCAEIGFDVPLDAFRAVVLGEARGERR
jgi:hypothetical protein